MIALSFRQTSTEWLLRAATTIIFQALKRARCVDRPLSDLIDGCQYGVTTSASTTPVGPKFVRITDLKDGQVDWSTVPFCECPDVSKYKLQLNDLLFARTGATTGKTHLVTALPSDDAVFASYLIRVRPSKAVDPGYLAAFF